MSEQPSNNSQPTQDCCCGKPAYQVVSTELLEQALGAREQLLRLRADFENFRKRIQKEREEALRYANEALISDLLTVLDNFELGMKATEGATDAKSIAQGLGMVLTQMQKLLSEEGLETIDATGQAFDHNLHDAVSKEPSDEVPEGHVIVQHRKGYTLRGKLLRPATVVVAEAPAS